MVPVSVGAVRHNHPVSNESDFTLHAWIDESIHAAAGYIVAATIAAPAACEAHRDAVRAAAPSSRRRMHWREEESKDRLRIAEALGQLDVAHTIVVASPIDPRKPERARRKCLELLFLELEALGVTQAWLETRTDALNRRDLFLVDALRGAGTLTGALHVDFGDPNVEPMLWIPDAIAGAFGAARRGNSVWRDALGVTIDVIEINL